MSLRRKTDASQDALTGGFVNEKGFGVCANGALGFAHEVFPSEEGSAQPAPAPALNAVPQLEPKDPSLPVPTNSLATPAGVRNNRDAQVQTNKPSHD